MDSFSVFVGFDPREADAFAVARSSIRRHMTIPVPVYGVVLDDLRRKGLYWRETERRDGRLWDTISGAPMSTEFAISRFLVPVVAKTKWALFVDADVMARTNVARLIDIADDSFAVMCVKHDFAPPEGVKMDGQAQLPYPRKNWSSVVLWNLDHEANRNITAGMVNELPGRDLHRFCWLEDEHIGELPARWNHLVGHHEPTPDAAIVHFTDGVPSMPGYEESAFADEWRAELRRWAA